MCWSKKGLESQVRNSGQLLLILANRCLSQMMKWIWRNDQELVFAVKLSCEYKRARLWIMEINPPQESVDQDESQVWVLLVKCYVKNEVWPKGGYACIVYTQIRLKLMLCLAKLLSMLLRVDVFHVFRRLNICKKTMMTTQSLHL